MKIAAFTACDEANLSYAKKLITSFKYFHPDIDFVLFTSAKKDLPKGVKVTDITKHIQKISRYLVQTETVFCQYFNE